MAGGRDAELGGRKTATLRWVEATAYQLFVDKGFSSVTAEEIATASGISVRTFYRYFPDGKEGLVLRRARLAVDELAEALRRRPPQESARAALFGTISEVLREWNSEASASSQPSFEVSNILYSQIAMQDSTLLARLIGERVLLLEPVVEQLALRMSVDPAVDVRPRLLAHAANSSITAAWFMVQENPSLDWAELVEESLAVLAAGFDHAALRSVAGSSGTRADVRPSAQLID